MKNIALITGIAGQDGSYLAEFLLKKGYQVVGLDLKQAILEHPNIHSIRKDIELVPGNLSDMSSLYSAVQRYQPDELYNLAAQSHPGDSWKLSIETGDITGLGAHRLLEVVRQIKPDCRVYQASSSEMFGNALESPQDETTPFNPVNPYAAAKIYAYQLARIYRESYGMFIGNGILFNHESSRRDLRFITQKVTYGAACLKCGMTHSPELNEEGEPIVKEGKIALGNLEAKRDWGYARDYVEAMWLILQQDTPDDFVIGTGILRSVRDLCETAFHYVGLNWEDYVTIDQRFFRPVETKITVANAAKANKILGWRPSTDFVSMIGLMVESHLKRLKE